MNKLTREQKEKLKNTIEEMWEEVSVAYLDLKYIKDVLQVITEITDTDFIDLDTSWSLEEIKAIPEGDDYDILHEIPGLKKVESYVEDNGEDKYKYTVSVFLHEKSGKHLMWTFQDCARSGAFLSFCYNGEVEKKEVTTTRWV